ncbi:flagellar hook-length control protein [mine drainage metagenome]|uniref:Flagellar hook-length control protein n=1 Tax=mine drainage metagenome TaxID=410659 RepID=A0A1J5QPA5_9ZZZZ
MDVVTLPIVSAPQSSVQASASPAPAASTSQAPAAKAGQASGDQPAGAAQAGSAPEANPFAKLLAKQIHADAKDATVIVGTDATKAAVVPDAAAAPVDPALLLQQQAAMLMPVPVQQNVSAATNATAKSSAPVDMSAMLSSGPAAAVKGEAQWQSVAASPAGFAASDKAAGSVPAGPGDAAMSSFDRMLALKSAQAESTPVTTSSPLPSPVGVPAQTATPQTSTVQVSSIPQAVGHSAWGDMLGNRVVWMVGQQHQDVELHLNPPALGPLEVRVSMSDGQANLSFATQHLPVKEAIEAATGRLREMLGESGIGLGSVSVNMGSFAQQQQQQNPQTPSNSGRPLWEDSSPVIDFSAAQTRTTSMMSRNGMVDIFA